MSRSPYRVTAIAGLAAIALLWACSDAPSAPFPPASDPAAIRLGQLLFACGSWTPGAAPAVPTALVVDLLFRPDTAFLGPSAAELAALRARGASIIYTYSFPAARAVVNSAQVPSLADSGLANAIVSVPDAQRFDWRFIIVMPDALTSADSAYVVRLGGLVVGMLRGINFIIADLPDASVPYLRRWSRPLFAEPNSWACLGGAVQPAPAAAGVFGRY